jgi:GT2 family glycosyltransferase
MSDVTPVVIFGYNRADLLDQTLRALRREQVPVIYAFIDGPRTPADERRVDAVRRTIRSVDWTEITIVERPLHCFRRDRRPSTA